MIDVNLIDGEMQFTETFRVKSGASTHKWYDKLANYIRTLQDGVYAVTVKEYKSKRSLEQNALYWKWISIIGNDLGYHKNEMHEALLEHLSIPYTFKGIDGKVKQKQLRTSMMNTQQMSDYMFAVEQFAAEQSINLPRPDENN
jgi:hypothetical protein